MNKTAQKSFEDFLDKEIAVSLEFGFLSYYNRAVVLKTTDKAVKLRAIVGHCDYAWFPKAWFEWYGNNSFRFLLKEDRIKDLSLEQREIVE